MENPDHLNEWLHDLFSSIDRRDAAAFVEFLAPDAVFQFGSAPPVSGRAAIQEAVASFFTTIAGCGHELKRTWAGTDTVVCEGKVTYQRHDGSTITLPFANVFELRDSLIDRYSIYADVGPLYRQR